MSNGQQDWESKIAGLLAKAEDERIGHAERELFWAKAQELMVKKGISEVQARAKQGKAAKAEEIVIRNRYMKGRYARGHMMIAFAIIRNFGGLRGYKTQRHNSEENTIFMVGFESDVQRAMTLLESLITQAELDRKAWWSGSVERSVGVKGRDAWKLQRNFLLGFASEIGPKVKSVYDKAAREAEQSTPGTELMLRDRDREVNDWLNDNVGGLRRGKGLSVGYGGHDAGRAAGRRADVGGGRIGGQGAIES